MWTSWTLDTPAGDPSAARRRSVGMHVRAALVALALTACGAPRPLPLHRDPAYDVAAARARPGAEVDWQPWAPATFARAQAEGRRILVYGVAKWCHWCHVMAATTYRDPAVVARLDAGFVAVKFDADARPDLGARYADYGWPATVLLTPEAEEIGAYRGYLEPAEMLGVLERAASAAPRGDAADAGPVPPVEALPWIAARALRDLDAYYDRAQGGWGRRQKLPLGRNVLVELRRAAAGDAASRARALQTLRAHRKLMDPVWGGLYQYSVPNDWDHPHFEKLMIRQAPNLEAFQAAHALFPDAGFDADARAIAGYVRAFLTNADGAFLVSQDADVGAHDPDARFVDGHDYFPLDDAGRRALGVPWVDPHVYPFTNGLAIAAFARMGPAEVAAARRAAAVVTRDLMDADGSLRRPAQGRADVRYLADAAAFGLGLARLAEVTGDAALVADAGRVADAMLRDFGDADGDALFETTPDAAAVGAFARRRRPFEHNVRAARLLAALAALEQNPARLERARRLLAAVATPGGLADQGRVLGGFLLACGEVGMAPDLAAPVRSDRSAAR